MKVGCIKDEKEKTNFSVWPLNGAFHWHCHCHWHRNYVLIVSRMEFKWIRNHMPNSITFSSLHSYSIFIAFFDVMNSNGKLINMVSTKVKQNLVFQIIYHSIYDTTNYCRQIERSRFSKWISIRSSENWNTFCIHV